MSSTMALTFSLPPIRSYKDLAVGAVVVSGVSEEHATNINVARRIAMLVLVGLENMLQTD